MGERIFFHQTSNIPTGLQDSIARTMYTIINAKIEKSSKHLNWALIKINIPIGFLPPIISTIVIYYILDLGSDSFIMPVPMMYVLKYFHKNLMKFFL